MYGDWCQQVRLIETHISYVILTGRFAFKVKKAVNLGFLDFTTLPARHFYCERELELNRRLAPDIYLEVVAITGTSDVPHIGGDGPPLEYAVKMREFPQEALLTRVLTKGELSASHVDNLAAAVAAFHGTATARTDSRFGTAGEIHELAVENFTELEPRLERESDRRALAALRTWTEREHAARTTAFAERLNGRSTRPDRLASVPGQDLDPIAASIAKQKQMARERVQREALPDERGQPVDRPSQVGRPRRQINPDRG